MPSYPKLLLKVAAATFIVFATSTLNNADPVSKALEKVHNWATQPQVTSDGVIRTSQVGKQLSYTMQIRAPTVEQTLFYPTGLKMDEQIYAGAPFNVSMDFVVTEETIPAVKADVTVQLGKTLVYNRTVDVCQDILPVYAKEGLKCPLDKGSHKFSATLDMPNNIPRARYNVTITLHAPNSEKSLIFSIDADFLFHGTWLSAYENMREAFKTGVYAVPRHLASVLANVFNNEKLSKAEAVRKLGNKKAKPSQSRRAEL